MDKYAVQKEKSKIFLLRMKSAQVKSKQLTDKKRVKKTNNQIFKIISANFSYAEGYLVC